jgi:hypothetical protein
MFLRVAVLVLVGCLFALPSTVLPLDSAYAASTKKPAKKKSTSDYSPEERKKIMEYARQLCKKTYGAPSQVYRLDYSRMRVICTQPGY